MAIQFSVSARNARLEALETSMGASPVLKLRTGAQPLTVATADSGTVLCSMTLPADALAVAAAGVKVKAGTWFGTASGGGGTIAHFRIYQSDGTTCVMQGSCASGSGDLALDNAAVLDGQVVTVTAFAITDGNA